MSTELQTQPAKGLAAWVADTEVRGRFAAMLGETIPVDQFVTHMLTALQNSKIAGCSDKSKYKAIHECAVLSLLPTLDQVVLIPFGAELKAMPTWQGYKAVMERHPDIAEVAGTLVHIDDTFTFRNGSLVHEYDPLGNDREIKSVADIRGGYCTILFTNGRPPKYHFTKARYIQKAQACAQTQDIWNKWYEQMALKTLYRDCYARRAVPVDPLVGERLRQIMRQDDVNLGNDPSRLPDDNPKPPPLTTADIMGTTEPEPPAEEPVSKSAEISLCEEYLLNIGMMEKDDDLTQTKEIVNSSTELNDAEKEIVLTRIKRREAILSRGERSNTKP